MESIEPVNGVQESSEMSGQIRVLPSWNLSFSQACEEEIRDCVAKEITLIPSSFVARVGKICASVELDYE